MMSSSTSSSSSTSGAGDNQTQFVVEFFYDVVSPYSYFAFEELLRLQAEEWQDVLGGGGGRREAAVVLRPFFLGAVMHAAGNRPPATVPAKGSYMMGLDVPRYARALGLTIQLPSSFPASTLLAQRVLTALDRQDRNQRDPQARLRAATRRMWQLYWGGEGGDITNPETLASALVYAGCSSQEATEILAKAQGTRI